MFVETMNSGQPMGEVGSRIATCNFDPGFMRPYIAEDGHRYITVNKGTQYDEKLKREVPVGEAVRVSDLIANGMPAPTMNATLGLRKDEWLLFDRAVVKAARQRLKAWGDLVAAGNVYGGFNGMSKLVLEHEAMSDPGEAVQDMEGLTEGRSDAPIFQLRGLPLPITHSNYSFSARRLAASRNEGMPLDTTMAEASGRRVAEMIEKSVIGSISGITYGNTNRYDQSPTIYGYLNHPQRLTKTDLTAPTASNGTTVVDEILAMREQLYANGFYGPFMVYVSTNYDKHLDNDFKAGSDKTTRQRVQEIDGIKDIRRLDLMTGDKIIMVQMTADVARAIDGMGITTMQWDVKGGMQTNFKTMAIQVPQIRADINGNSGLCVGTTS